MKTKTPFYHNTQTLIGHAAPIYGGHYADGVFYSSSMDKHVVGWDLQTGKQTGFVAKLERPAYKLTYIPFGKKLIIGESNGQMHVIDLQHQQEVRLLAKHRSSIFSLTYDEKTNRLYSGDREGTFCAWDAADFTLLCVRDFNCGRISDIAVSEDSRYIALCGQDGLMRILETKTFCGKKAIKMSDYTLKAALFDGDFLYVGGKTAYISRWNWREEKRYENFKAHSYAIYDLAFMENKSLLVSASFDKTLKIWSREDLSLCEEKNKLGDGHRSSVNEIIKISDSTFATISDDRKIKVWEAVAQ